MYVVPAGNYFVGFVMTAISVGCVGDTEHKIR